MSDKQIVNVPQIVRHEPQAIVPRSLGEAIEFAKLIADTPFVPKDMRGRPGDVAAAIMLGAESGLAPITALQHIAVINGRPSVWGDVALALVMASGLLEWIDEDVGDSGATCTVKRRGWPESASRTFTIEDARRAGLLGKPGPWQQYPKRMLQMRARSWALRDTFPDVLRGLSVREEVLDLEPAEPLAIEKPAEGTKLKRGVAAVRAAVMPAAPEEEMQQSDENAVQAPQQEDSQAKGRKREPLIVREPDGSTGSSVMSVTAWLSAYRKRMAVLAPESRPAMAAQNIELLRRFAAAARERGHESADELDRELEAAEALVASLEQENEQLELLG